MNLYGGDIRYDSRRKSYAGQWSSSGKRMQAYRSGISRGYPVVPGLRRSKSSLQVQVAKTRTKGETARNGLLRAE